MAYKSIEKQREYQRDHVHKSRKARHKKLLEGKSCERCGFSDFRALEFHHTDPKKKDFNIGRILTYRMDLILSEIEKCEILCANCHRIHHSMHNR